MSGKLIHTWFLLLFSCGLYASGNTVMLASSPDPTFIYMEHTVDTTGLKYIRTFHAESSQNEDLSNLFKLIRTNAVKAGANCFKLRAFNINQGNSKVSLTLATYQASDLQLHIILNHQERNTIYLISDLHFNKQEHNVRINGVKHLLKSGTCFQYHLKENEAVSLVKGGKIAGSALKIHWIEGRMPVCYSVNGFNISQVPYPSYYTSFGLMFGIAGVVAGATAANISSGKFVHVEPDFALLLKDILPKHGE